MSWLTDLFGGKKQKQQAVQLQSVPTLSGTSEYPLYKKTLEDRMSGMGLGYDPNVLSAATNPYATQVRTNFQQNTVPSINAAASAKGLGRSTIPVNEISRGSQAVEQDIGTKIANLQLANEQEKATEKQNAISGYGTLMGQDYNSILNNINSQNAQAAEAARVQNANNASSLASEAQGISALSTVAAPLLATIPGVGPFLSAGANALGGYSNAVGNNATGKESASVNLSGADDLIAQLKKLLAGGGGSTPKIDTYIPSLSTIGNYT